MTHYNTTHESGKTLKDYESKAKTQEKMVLDFFASNCETSYAPHHVLEILFDNKIPLTSVRRSISNLTDKKKLYKTETKVNGLYGRPTYTWKYLKKG